MTAVATPPKTQPRGSVIVTRKTLIAALSLAKRVASGRNSKPVLNCVRLVAGEHGLIVEATDLAQACRQVLTDVQLEQSFVALPNLDKLLGVLGVMKSDAVTIRLDGEGLKLTDEGGVARIGIHANLDDFPPIPEWPEQKADFSMPAAVFASMFEQVKRGVKEEQASYTFHGVHVSAGETVVFESTDGRMACRAVSDVKPARKFAGIIPTSPFVTISSAAGEDSVIDCVAIKNQISFRVDDFELHHTTLEGTFPPIDDVIQQYLDDTHAEIAVEDFTAAVRRIDAVDSGQGLFGCACTFKAEGIAIESRGSDDKSTTTYACKVTGKNVVIGFKPDRLLALLASCPSDTLKLSVVAANRPLQAVSNHSSGTFYCVLMPVNLT